MLFLKGEDEVALYCDLIAFLGHGSFTFQFQMSWLYFLVACVFSQLFSGMPGRWVPAQESRGGDTTAPVEEATKDGQVSWWAERSRDPVT